MSKVYSGTAISPGLALGQLQLCQMQPQTALDCPQQLLEQEQQSLMQLLQQPGLSEAQQQLLQADQLLVSDPELLLVLRQQQAQGKALHQAVLTVFNNYADQLAELGQPELSKRADEMRLLGQRLSRQSQGQRLQLPQRFEQPTILLVADLTAAEFIQLPKENLAGVILARGSRSDHLGILLRAAAIAAIVFEDACHRLPPSAAVMIDGDAGQITLATSDADKLLFDDAHQQWQQRLKHYRHASQQQAQLADGSSVWLGANIAHVDDCPIVHQQQLDGVGLLRTELLYLNHGQWPSKQQQIQHYCAIAKALDGKPLTIRSFDFGADKPLPGLRQQESNPALGERAIRLGLSMQPQLVTQLQAIIEVARHYPVRLLLPMVSTVEELQQTRQLLDLQLNALAEPVQLQVGVMIETPASVMMLPEIAKMADFASIGSNDLAQYCLAVDRTNGRLAPKYPELSPPVIRLIAAIAEQCQQLGLPISLCGEMGSDLKSIPLLLAFGIRRFSISPNRAGEVKFLMSQFDPADGSQLLAQALACATTESLHKLLTGCNAYQKTTKMADSSGSQMNTNNKG